MQCATQQKVHSISIAGYIKKAAVSTTAFFIWTGIPLPAPYFLSVVAVVVTPVALFNCCVISSEMALFSILI